ncbi:hypothetical protein DEI92_13705 [Curtobacterium sp. MCBD17_034]|uniref:hypothetical protein n=1 Tax=unclassified Curtobacterium TaxID=257496 RepID=UPI000DA92CE6|nr:MULTISPECIES: hypothetical protein [unclassified Curtobacterium]PZF56840.1 hypothetical protein DEI92_13705 [Curtobacterium sp. MCBD17_034]PZM33796.1 hypothetical protein DEI90_11090 [Curtobacterium sp. MCBD17_031]
MIGPRSSAARHGAEGASTAPHPLARAVVDLAVALSPADHRPVRMEQWHADLRDAADLDLPRAGLAFGALTTALFHRRAVHRSGASRRPSSPGVSTTLGPPAAGW